jgi:hypothetical protein
MNRKSAQLRDTVILIGLGPTDSPVFEQKLSVHDYYDGEHEVIDQPQFRRRRNIVKLCITFHGATGEIERRVECRYGPDGEVIDRREL